MATASAAKPAPKSASATPKSDGDRLMSVDAYRGLVMIALAANGFGIYKTSQNFADNIWWQRLGHQFEHVPWVGCVFWDLIQPSFMFLVGVAAPWSLANRLKRGQSWFGAFLHAVLRSVILILLGVMLSSNGASETNYTFVNVLTQIGLGYLFVFLLTPLPIWSRLIAITLILGGYWAWFAQAPLPPPGVPNPSVGVPQDWPHLLSGFEAHWQKNANPAHRVDVWLLNQFPRSEPFRFNGGGYQTLNFIPSIATMLFGSVVGTFLCARPPAQLVLIRLVGGGVLMLLAGLGMDMLGFCPLVKRIWTPSWTLFSTGWCFLMLAGFYAVVDGLKWRWWVYPLVIAGMNSILLYVMSQLMRPWTGATLRCHLGENYASFLGAKYAPLVEANAILLVFWLIVWWLSRQKIFVRI